MTADTETIRQAVNAGGVMAKIHSQSLAVFEAALAALGRVEERERALTEALEEIAANPDARVRSMEGNEIEPWRHRSGQLMGSPRLIARAALAGSVAEEEQTDFGRARARRQHPVKGR